MPISLGTLKEILTAGRTSHTFYPISRQPNAPKRQKQIDNATPNVYGLENIADLIQILHTVNAEFPNDPLKYSTRYLMENNTDMLVAQEGAPNGRIPRHRDMSSRCVAAGNLYLSQDLQKVIGINHDSGDFEPSMASLIRPLKILVDSILLDDAGNFSIHYRANPEAEIETLTISVNALKTMLASIPLATETRTAVNAHAFFTHTNTDTGAAENLEAGYATP